jgi:hypothetical protein
MANRSPDDEDAAAGIARLEGYLLCQSEIRRARIEAETFVRRLPWLTTAQQEEVVRQYAQERLSVSKEALRMVAARCAELQDEYTARYQALRLRLLCRCVALLLASATLCSTACLVAVHR